MPKILLVEDDNNLREIFEMRLQTEGYKTVSAGDGEEALDVAVKEKPDLIIADIMMPKLSGFEMLETLRASPDMANAKVIMMTALGQAEDRARGEKLGVVKYLVKSQVTLEDFVRVVREVLPPSPDAASPSSSSTGAAKSDPQVTNKQESEKSMQEDNSTPTSSPAPADNGMGGTNPISDAPAGDASASGAMSTADEQKAVDDQVSGFAPGAPAAPSEPAADSPAPAAPGDDSMGGDSSMPSDPAPAGDSGSGMPAAPASEDPSADSSAPSSPAGGTM